jgi:hypothetical protein
MNRLFAYPATVAVWYFALTASAASAVLDQSSPTGQNTTFVGTAIGNTPGDRAHTFTVGLGGWLTEIEVYVSQNTSGSPLLLDVRPTDANGRPLASNESILASASNASVLGTPSFASFDISAANLIVSPGDRLAIVLRSSLAEYVWYGQVSNPYGGGSGFYRSGFSSVSWSDSVNPSFDVAFRTYVSPVPEPEGHLLIASMLTPLASKCATTKVVLRRKR